MKGIIRHQPQHHWDISKPIDQVYGIMFDLDLFKGENDNEFFLTSSSTTPMPLTLEFIELVPN